MIVNSYYRPLIFDSWNSDGHLLGGWSKHRDIMYVCNIALLAPIVTCIFYHNYMYRHNWIFFYLTILNHIRFLAIITYPLSSVTHSFRTR